MHSVDRSDEMFPAEVSGIAGQFHWDPRGGWYLFVAHVHEGEARWRCEPLQLERLNLTELLTALDTYVASVRGWERSSF